MPTYQIEFKKQAVRFIKSRTQKEQRRLLAEIYKLPDTSNIKKMQEYDYRYRLRVGDVRIIYDKLDGVLIIHVVEIGNKGKIY